MREDRKMEGNMFKKGLVVGIIFLFIGVGVVPSISGNEKSDSINITHQGNSKADLKIINAYVGCNGWGYPSCGVDIQNCGNGAVPSWTNIRCSMTMKKLLQNESVCFFLQDTWWTINPFDPGEIEDLYMGYLCADELPFFFLGRIFFEVDPDNIVDESNEKNNVVWTYIYTIVFALDYPWGFCFVFIGPLRQLHPKNVGIT
jgi:hypothetical protein